MKKRLSKKTIYFILALIPLLIMAKIPGPSSSGAPASHTGAPEEKTCATVGCHDNNAINSGKAILSISADDSIAEYIPGNTYTVKVKISEPGVSRFGFQLLALSDQNHGNAGVFKIVDKNRTQLINNFHELHDREYVTYTFNGTDPIEDGVGEWEVNWTAPSTNIGPVAFYAGAVSANNDETDQGDYVYNKSLVLQSK